MQLKSLFSQVMRYGSVTIAGYASIILGTFLLVEYVRLIPSLAYVLTLSVVYIFVFFILKGFVFDAVDHSSQKGKFAISVVGFWTLNNIFYNILILKLDTHYLLAVIINILLFGALRFFVYKFWVFKTSTKLEQ